MHLHIHYVTEGWFLQMHSPTGHPGMLGAAIEPLILGRTQLSLLQILTQHPWKVRGLYHAALSYAPDRR